MGYPRIFDTNWRLFNVIPTAASILLRACNSAINYFSVQRGIYRRDDAETRIKQIMELTIELISSNRRILSKFLTRNVLRFQVAKITVVSYR